MKKAINTIMNYKRILGLALFIMSTGVARAQYDPGFSQYMFNETFINPAYTGSQEALSATVLSRNQWVGIEGAPKTQTVTLHTPLMSQKIGVGMGILNETIGKTKRTGFNLNYSYRLLLAKGTLSFGVQGGIMSAQEDLAAVKTMNGSDAMFQNTQRMTSPNFGFGTYYYTQNWFAGISIPRLIKNGYDAASNSGKNTLDANNFHYYLVGGYVLDVNDQFKLRPSVMMKFTSGAKAQADITLMGLVRNVLWLGGSFRTGDAISGILAWQFTPQLKAGYAYDYTTSKLSNYNSGTHEITLNYLFSFRKNNVTTPRLF